MGLQVVRDVRIPDDFGKTKMKVLVSPRLKKLSTGDTVPRDAYPQRIVECVSINDQRRIANITAPTTPFPCPGHKIFVRRDFLEKVYDPEQVLYCCEICCKKFIHLPVYNIHVRMCTNGVVKQQRLNNKRIEMRAKKMEQSDEI